MGEKKFEPYILGFLCRWCSSQGADLAGTSRIQYAPNIRTIRVMCSSRVEPSFVLKALKNGVDGVLIAGCHPGDCHYINGNYKTIRRIALLKKMLSQFGLDERRVRLEWVSASEGDKYARVVEEFRQELQKMGQSPFKTVEQMVR